MSFSERHWDAINKAKIIVIVGSSPSALGNLIHERMVRAIEGVEAASIVLYPRQLTALDDNIITAPAIRIKKGKGPRDKWGRLV